VAVGGWFVTLCVENRLDRSGLQKAIPSKQQQIDKSSLRVLSRKSSNQLNQ